jgi:hypothetical protein
MLVAGKYKMHEKMQVVPDAEPQVVLVVEDDGLISYMTATCLRNAGYLVLELASGRRGRQLAWPRRSCRHSPDGHRPRSRIKRLGRRGCLQSRASADACHLCFGHLPLS